MEPEATLNTSNETKVPSFSTALQIIAFGCMLSWAWLVIGSGIVNPPQERGYLGFGVILCFASAGALFLYFAFSEHSPFFLQPKRSIVLGLGILATGSSFALALAVSSTELTPVLVLALAEVCCLCGSWLLVLALRICFSFRPITSFAVALAAWIPCFFAYFLCEGFHSTVVRTLIFALLPLVSGTLLFVCGNAGLPKRKSLDRETAHEGERGRYIEMLIGIALFFFTIGFVRSVGLGQDTGIRDFALGSAPAVVLFAAYALAILVIYYRGALRATTARLCYACGALGLSFATVTMALTGVGLEPVRAVTDASYLALIPSIVAFMVAGYNVHGHSLERSIALPLGVALLASSAGWCLDIAVDTFYATYSATSTLLLSLGFLSFAYFMFGFPLTAYSSYIDPSMGKEESLFDKDEINPEDWVGRSLSFRDAATALTEEAGLSRREHEVFLLLLKGHSNERIAEELVVSYHTVRAHVRNIYAKLGVHNRQEMLACVEARKDSPHTPNTDK